MNRKDESVQVITRFWGLMQENDFRGASEFLHEDYVLEWPQSGERIRGRANFVAVNQQYPAAGRWNFTVHRLVADLDEVVTDVSVTDGTVKARAITFSTIREGRIWRQTEYWPDPFEPAGWRAQWVERL